MGGLWIEEKLHFEKTKITETNLKGNPDIIPILKILWCFVESLSLGKVRVGNL